MRLRNKKTKGTLIFVNHHGPLSVNSGGMCGGESTAHNILQLIKNKGKDGDIIVIVGDFNSNAAGTTISTLWQNLVFVYNGDSFGGVDNVFTNVPVKNTVEKRTMSTGGSDHKAVTVTIKADAVKDVRKGKWRHHDNRRRRRWHRNNALAHSSHNSDRSVEPWKAVK